MDWARGVCSSCSPALLLALLGEFAVAPRIVARENLRAVAHAWAARMYVLQWVCALVVLWNDVLAPATD